MNEYNADDFEHLSKFLNGKSDHTLILFNHFINEFQKIGPVTIHLGKTMIGLANSYKKIAYICQLGKDFIHVVFLFKQPFYDNLCFQKIVQMPGGDRRFTHHFRMLQPEDVNDELREFMKMAYNS